MDKKLLSTRRNFLILIIPLVFLAGCAGGGKEVTNDGVVITSFSPDLTEIEGNTLVIFTVDLKNAGGAKASGVKAVLFGLSDDWEGPNELNSFKPSVGTTLAAADSELGLPGEETSIDFSVKAKASAAKASDTTYDASVRVFYTYTTTSDTLLRFVKSDYLRTNPNTPKGIASSTATAGPLLITAAARTPTIPQDQTTGRVQFEITNIGPGKLGAATSKAGEVSSPNKIRNIEITGPTFVSGSKCASPIPPNELLATGGSKVISCDIDVRGITNFKDIAVKVRLTYDYYLDSFAKVKVLKSLDETATGAPSGTAPSGQPSAQQTVSTDEACKNHEAGQECEAASLPGTTSICCLNGDKTKLECTLVDTGSSCPP